MSIRRRAPNLLRRCLPGLLLALALTAACGGEGVESGTEVPAAGAGAGPLQVTASLPPLAWLADRVGGGRIETTVMLPPGASPHAWEPSPRQMGGLTAADLVVAVGDPHLAFEQRQVERLLAERPDVPVVRLTEAVAAERTSEDHRAAHLDERETRHEDPHLWVAPDHLRAGARAVAAALERADAAGADTYRGNLAALESELDALDADLRAAFAALDPPAFLVQHPAWGHLAAQHGLEQVAIEEEGKEPSPQRLVAVIERARRDGLRVVLVQPGVSDAAARAVAREVGAEVVTADPLAYDVPAALRGFAAAVAAGGEGAAR
jgi:zinc transport system substrate-binding protein